MVEKFGQFDPKLELGNFKFPTLNLLKEYNETIAVDAEELERNKVKIVETLKNYKIGIAKIKATVPFLIWRRVWGTTILCSTQVIIKECHSVNGSHTLRRFASCQALRLGDMANLPDSS